MSVPHTSVHVYTIPKKSPSKKILYKALPAIHMYNVLVYARTKWTTAIQTCFVSSANSLCQTEVVLGRNTNRIGLDYSGHFVLLRQVHNIPPVRTPKQTRQLKTLSLYSLDRHTKLYVARLDNSPPPPPPESQLPLESFEAHVILLPRPPFPPQHSPLSTSPLTKTNP